MTLVTLFTDASFSRTLQVATYAVWAKANGTTIRHSGKCKDPVPNSGTAELAAIANGLYFISKGFDCPSGSKIICQTDSLESITAITKLDHPRKEDRKIVAHIKEFARINGWTLDFRHIKGHQGDLTKRHAVNTWCDREARKLMGEILAKQKLLVETKKRTKAKTKLPDNVVVLRNNKSLEQLSLPIETTG